MTHRLDRAIIYVLSFLTGAVAATHPDLWLSYIMVGVTSAWLFFDPLDND